MELIMLIAFLLFVLIAFLLCNRLKNLQHNNELLETVTIPYRGTSSERRLILELLKLGIPSQTIFHDLYVRRPIGNYSQIDVVVPTRVGIIVFEVKDYSGWLFGKGYQSHWCQVLAYGEEKHRFYNPIKQNETHIASLRQILKQCISEYTPIYSVIVFYGSCVFKNISGIPNNTYVIKPHLLHRVISEILNRNINAGYVNKWEVIRLLREAVTNGENPQIVTQHQQTVRSIANQN